MTGILPTSGQQAGADPLEIRDENRRIRYLRILTDMTHQRLCIEAMTLMEAREAVRELRYVAGNMFPGKDSVFDLVIAPRLERVIEERFGKGSLPPAH